jgi:hypothetical protein
LESPCSMLICLNLSLGAWAITTKGSTKQPTQVVKYFNMKRIRNGKDN